jgi:periplasmic divalent cation tolerance protein
MKHHSVVLTTVGSEEEASKLARSLVDFHLAACVSIIPNVRSVYNWKDKLHEDQECMLVIKTASALAGKLQAHFAAYHPYEVPEFVVLRIAEESPAYLSWMASWLDPSRSHQSRDESQKSKVESHKPQVGRKSQVKKKVAGRKSKVESETTPGA